MKSYLFFLLSLATFASLGAQEMNRSVVGSAGAYFSDFNAGNLHWTLGEISVAYHENGRVLSEGFHQTYSDLVLTALWEAPELDLSLDVYPNPTVGQLTLEGDWQVGDQVQFLDLQGRLLLRKALDPRREVFQMNTFQAGVYFLTILRAGKTLKTFRVVKQ